MPDVRGAPIVNQRVRLDGKFFRAGTERFVVRGVTYGSFGPNQAGEPFPEPEQAGRDFDLMVTLGANTVRVYDIPPRWLIDAAALRGLRLLVSIPWRSESCFLDTRNSRREARTAVTSAVQALDHQPAILAVALANEIPPDILRWSGAHRVGAFLDELVVAVHDVDPDCLCTYSNYPPTEFLQPRELDFITFNVFLHTRHALLNYLNHLQILADGKPLLLGECGIDSRREGLARQAEILSWTLEATVTAGLAGAIVFSFTDDWVRGGVRVEDWAMGLTTIERERRPAFTSVQSRFLAPPPRPARSPRVSVVVAAYNAAATLPECLDALLQLNHPDYEIIVIDDGSIDDTPRITAKYSTVRTLRLKVNEGLSRARNLGIRAATGEIIAFTDADCRVDPDWLRFLVSGLLDSPIAGIGGPNFLPPEDPPLAAVVMTAPGGPVQVLLDDRFAEHIPGCNMAFWKWALEAVGGFDPVFRTAGDDVDLCWRLQRRGWKLGFTGAGFVWHHRRSSIRAYLTQQAGYGEAEALLLTKHPANFNALGSARWQGRIGGSDTVWPWRQPSIFRGIFATGMFQTLYTPASEGLTAIVASLEYHIVVVLPLALLALSMPGLWSATLIALLLPMALAGVAGYSTPLARGARGRWWARPVLSFLFYLQPLVRGAARHRARLSQPMGSTEPSTNLEAESEAYEAASTGAAERAYWSATARQRRDWVERILAALEDQSWPCRADQGWSDFDLEIYGSQWNRLALVTVAETTRDGAQVLRCRLRPRWTLPARMIFWGTLAAQLGLIGLFQVNWRGWWIPIVTLAALGFFYRLQARRMQARIGVLLDAVARGWGLTLIQPKGPDTAEPESAHPESDTTRPAHASDGKPWMPSESDTGTSVAKETEGPAEGSGKGIS
ncbi:MAG: glycosyltransferase [Verrucomicrobiales bacterium]|nr:glycosyltransferase [Verrucomicrobiales bacterium]